MELARDRLYRLTVKEEMISLENLVVMVTKWMTEEEVEEMLDANELSARFDENE